MKKVIVGIMGVLLLSTSAVWASGLAIPEQGAAAMGMSAAMTARSEDLSAIFYNPAGIDYVENNEVLVGLTPIMPGHKFEGEGVSVDSEQMLFFPPQLYAARRFHDRVVLGLGVYVPFGLGTDWDKTWKGRYTSTFAEIQTIYVNPTISFKVNEMISLGLGVSYINSSAQIEKMIDSGLTAFALGVPGADASWVSNTAFDTEFSLDGDGSGFGFNLGAIVRPIEKLQLGISYRGATDIEYEGTAKFKHPAALAAALSASMPPSQDGTATLHLPWMLNLGATYDITDIWDVGVDVDLVGWSVYDELTIDFETDQPFPEQTLAKDWDNSYVFRLGTSYDINETLKARGGFMYDQTPIPDETFDAQLPGNDRIGVSLGVGYKIGIINIDASYLLLKFSDRDKDNHVGFPDLNKNQQYDATDAATLNALGITNYSLSSGTYKSLAHLLSISASYKF